MALPDSGKPVALILGGVAWRGRAAQKRASEFLESLDIMPMAPYDGQGMPLGKNAGYSGDWIIGGKYFLCPGIGNDTPVLRAPGGEIAIGFSADQLAALFEISTDELMASKPAKGTFNSGDQQAANHRLRNAAHFRFLYPEQTCYRDRRRAWRLDPTLTGRRARADAQ
jgi:hypothetical protein